MFFKFRQHFTATSLMDISNQNYIINDIYLKFETIGGKIKLTPKF